VVRVQIVDVRTLGVDGGQESMPRVSPHDNPSDAYVVARNRSPPPGTIHWRRVFRRYIFAPCFPLPVIPMQLIPQGQSSRCLLGLGQSILTTIRAQAHDYLVAGLEPLNHGLVYFHYFA